MITLKQGDTSSIIEIPINQNYDISEDTWKARLVIVESINNLRPLISKELEKNTSNSFFTYLLPVETQQLNPGKYIIGIEIYNESLNYSKELEYKLIIKQQLVYNTMSHLTSGSNTLPPSGDILNINNGTTIKLLDRGF